MTCNSLHPVAYSGGFDIAQNSFFFSIISIQIKPREKLYLDTLLFVSFDACGYINDVLCIRLQFNCNHMTVNRFHTKIVCTNYS